jgi:hypothetical protein
VYDKLPQRQCKLALMQRRYVPRSGFADQLEPGQVASMAQTLMLPSQGPRARGGGPTLSHPRNSNGLLMSGTAAPPQSGHEPPLTAAPDFGTINRHGLHGG